MTKNLKMTMIYDPKYDEDIDYDEFDKYYDEK